MPLKATIVTILSGAVVAFASLARSSLAPPSETQVAATLDAFHLAASKADGERYFSLFAPDGVFLGTDATERWNVEEFKAYAKPHFDKGQGWTYAAIEGHRFITIAADGRTAWFDELLTNEKYGVCRGSGVMRRTGEEWRIAQYNLALMIPNDVAKDVVAMVRASKKGSDGP